MPFAPGDRVHIPRLGTGVVLEVRNGGRYLVEIKAVTMVVDGGGMEHAAPARPTRSNAGAAPSDTPAPPSHTTPTIDLHGKTVDEAVEALDTFMNDALLAAHAQVRVIHGRSGGRIRDAIHKRLRELTPVRSFRIVPRNAGVTIVGL